jgi:hypothetical protein
MGDAGAGARLILALAVTYLALGAFAHVVYGADLATSAFGVFGALLLLVLAAGVAWATARKRSG